MKCFDKPLLSLILSLVLLFQCAYSQTGNMHDMSGMDMSSTKFKRPLTVPSNEATKKQLKLAAAEGNAVDKCINWITNESGVTAATLTAGEYKITWAISPAEGWYIFNDNQLTWLPPAKANAHIWLFVQDGADHRIVPPLHITAEIRNRDGTPVMATDLPFAWMPLINGYGNNLNFPKTGRYRIDLKIDPPDFHRHDPYNGDRFTDVTRVSIPIEINLSKLSEGRLLSEAMENQMSISKQIGLAYANTLKNMYKQANDGRDTTIGDYKVAYAVEYAEGFWDYEHGKFRYKVENDLSGATNAHVEVAVLDKSTGRFLDQLNVTASLEKGRKSIGTMTEHFMWHPWLYHYGENWRVSSSGSYRLKVHFDPPAYRRYGKVEGRKFAHGETLIFGNVKIKTGQK